MAQRFAPRTLAALTALAGFAALTVPALADPPVPSYATPGETIHGTIASITGGDLYLNDDRGFIDHVVLRDRTIVNPSGAGLAPEQAVTIVGRADGRVFRADEIEIAAGASGGSGDAGSGGYADGAGYAYDGSGDVYDGAAYPYYPYYPYYGYGWPYFSTSFYFGFHGGGYYPHGGYYSHGGYPHGGYAGHGGYVPHAGGFAGGSRGAGGFAGGSRGTGGFGGGGGGGRR
jgi:hypothetical protein